MKQLNEFEKQMLIYRIDNLKNLSNKDFMVSFAGIVNDFDLLQKEDIENLQDHDWCRDNIRHEYTIIKPLSKNVSNALVEEKKDNTGRQRYYDNVFYIKGKNVLLSSEWYDGTGRKPDNKTIFVNWLRGLVNSNPKGYVQVSNSVSHYPCQQIFYGAPGTGKSNTIKRVVDEQEKRCHRTTFHPDSDYSTFVGAYKPTMKESYITKDRGTTKEEKIIYTFCPQAFTNAYVEAWNTEEEVYLVIEEINRGNCAQIFGDLFQLLDRKNGVSEYPVEADADLHSYLNKALAKTTRTDIPDDVKSGKKLMLPSNLYIWATMNTSDQSLFPIDSAFKRRWEWKYIKIADAHKDWKIEANGEDWYGFICQINRIISNMTSSADKQLGYFFCQTNEDRKITTETFVSKVIFYLWNDVFKDYGFEDASLFKYKKVDKDGNRFGDDLDLTFPDFYDEDGNVAPDVVAQFIEHVMAWKGSEKE